MATANLVLVSVSLVPFFFLSFYHHHYLFSFPPPYSWTLLGTGDTIVRNAEFLEEIAASGGMPFDLNMPEDESPSNSNSNVPSRAPSPLHPPSSAAPPEPQPSVSRKQPDQRELDSSQDRIRSTLRQFVRDWSVEGAVEREACYTPCLKALEEIWPNKEERKGIKVLVPGAGLGRLALEIARKGELWIWLIGISKKIKHYNAEWILTVKTDYWELTPAL